MGLLFIGCAVLVAGASLCAAAWPFATVKKDKIRVRNTNHLCIGYTYSSDVLGQSRRLKTRRSNTRRSKWSLIAELLAGARARQPGSARTAIVSSVPAIEGF